MVPGESADDLADLMARWRAWSLGVMREYHGRAMLWGEAAALEWLEAQKFDRAPSQE